jgi:predicted PolB exonuclease-like 3'-5' exonuclease
VCISFVAAAITRDPATGLERYHVTACASGGEADWDERRLLEAWWSYLSRTHARVVTWNGRGFDLPVLRLRALLHGLSAATWFRSGGRYEGYHHRYSEDWHCDLMEVLADHGASARMGLDDMAHALGLPGKIGGHGSEVAGLVERGEIDQVRAYCEGDCANLFALYLRWALLSGRTDPAGHDAGVRSFVDHLERHRGSRAHLGEFLDRWRSRVAERPCAMFVGAGSPDAGLPASLEGGVRGTGSDVLPETGCGVEGAEESVA